MRQPRHEVSTNVCRTMTQAPDNWPAISRHVWETRYRWAGESDITETWRRVAREVASVESDSQELWAKRFAGLLEGFRFIPGGRILAGTGTDRRVTLFNCFVMGVIEDTLEGIFDALKQGALTMQYGGGIGYDFSTLRPSGSRARSSGSIASGPVSFMKIWDATCATMLSTGARRGAMMATLRCDHPDIEAFVEAKREPGILRHFNLSVQITDEFMAAVQADRDWPLVFPSHDTHLGEGHALRRRWTGQAAPIECVVLRAVPARRLWEQIVQAAYESAEPGVLFVDRINSENNLYYREHLTTTNPCGEIPLPPFGACNLGSLNLPAFVLSPFEPGAHIDYEMLQTCASTAVRFLDNVIDLSAFPLEQQALNAKSTRRIGLGLTGLGDALAMLGQRYDSWTALGLAEDVARRICHTAYEASVELAAERGSCEAFERDRYLQAPFIRRLAEPLRDRIARHGIRNSHLLAIAPAGTISLLAGNVSSGIEPIFSLEACRRILGADGRYRQHQVVDYAWSLWQSLRPGADPPDALVTALEIGAHAHLEMQATIQPWVDNAISKTINVPETMSIEEFRGIYERAYQKGLKGCTVFRPNPLRGAVLAPTEPHLPAAHCCDLEREPD